LDAALLRQLRIAKRVSLNLSTATCHGSKPIKVAIELKKLDQFKANQELLSLFQHVFNIECNEMTRLYDEGEK
jgi:hypothetical protein